MGTCTRTRSTSNTRAAKIRFGRVLVWFDDSPVALAAAVSLSLIVVGFFWLITIRSKRHPVAVVSVMMQPLLVEVSGLRGGAPGDGMESIASEFQIQPLKDTEHDDPAESELVLPEMPELLVRIKSPTAFGQNPDVIAATLERAAAEIRKAEELMQSRRNSAALGDPTTSRFFGLGEEGASSVVYVIDCSLSMDQPSYKFELAKRELMRSIASLKPEHRFYVIFFAGNPVAMPGSELVDATESNKERTMTWIKNVGVLPSTEPVAAMQQALRLKPDVVYLLSDGEFPTQYCTQIKAANRVTNPSTIYTIGFGNRSGEAQLLRIANDSGGQYRYVEFVER
jgi:hypothetical protein